MDAQRFDTLAKNLATRFSRRGALRRAGAAASASLLASAGIRSIPARAQGDEEPVYTMIRSYSLGGPASAVRQALQQGYIADACQAPGFIAYFAVEDDDDDFATVAVFRTQQDFENFANAEANWIAQNLGDLLPAPDSAISGLTYVHVGSREAFRNTCPGEPAPPAPTAAPTTAAPTAAPTAPTPAPAPTQAPAPSCTAPGCACSTGTQSPCDSGLICCPSTDIMGGPGVCQTQAVCYPNQCTSTGDGCAATCNWGDACPSCCTNYCNATGQCDNPPAACTGSGCACTTGVNGACDSGMVCCGTTGAPGGPGTCMSDAQCTPPCTSLGCDCIGGAQGGCDDGLSCCVQGDPGAPGTCQTEESCPGSLCVSEGCDCTSGTLNACADGLICCAPGEPGAPGTCQTPDNCTAPTCGSAGCECTAGVDMTCDDGLICCSGGGPGAAGTCQTDADCNAPNCTDIGGACDASCAADDSCAGCCSGYCNSSGQCDFAPTSCTGDGCDCISGTDGTCDDGLVCCAQGDPGAPGVCQASC